MIFPFSLSSLSVLFRFSFNSLSVLFQFSPSSLAILSQCLSDFSPFSLSVLSGLSRFSFGSLSILCQVSSVLFRFSFSSLSRFYLKAPPSALPLSIIFQFPFNSLSVLFRFHLKAHQVSLNSLLVRSQFSFEAPQFSLSSFSNLSQFSAPPYWRSQLLMGAQVRSLAIKSRLPGFAWCNPHKWFTNSQSGPPYSCAVARMTAVKQTPSNYRSAFLKRISVLCQYSLGSLSARGMDALAAGLHRNIF